MSILAVGAALAGCKKKEPPVAPKAAPAAAPLAAQMDLSKLPIFIDKQLYQSFHKTVEVCEVDTLRSDVNCKISYFSNIVKLYRTGGPRPVAMRTVSYALEHDKLAVKTVAVEFLNQAFPINSGGVPTEPEVRKLLDQMGKLPPAQAADLAPSVTFVATALKLEAELYKVVDGFSDQRVAIAAYQNLMVEGRLRVFDKIFTLAGSRHLGVAVAAVDAPRVMGGRMPNENEKLCGWMVELQGDSRPLIQARAGAFLTGCGPTYLEKVLAGDEARFQASKPLIAGLDAYRNVCSKGEKHPFGAPSPEQCDRLKKLATTVLNDPASREGERVQALSLLADQFAG